MAARLRIALVCLLSACGARSPAPAEDAPLPDNHPTARLRRILALIAQEDAPRPEQPKSRTVREQLDAHIRSVETARTSGAAWSAISRLERAYLESELDSTYPPVEPLPWSASDRRDQLGSATVDARIRAWQPPGHPGAFVKFAIPPGHPRVVRVGPWNARHVDIAGGPAIAAGVMRFRDGGARPVVIALENTSSGLRPGAPRNRTAVDALVALGYAPANPDDLAVYDNPTGEYERSLLAQPTR